MIEAAIQDDWHTDEVKIYLREGFAGSRTLTYYTIGEDSRLVPHERDRQSLDAPPCALRLPREAVKSIVDAAMPGFPPSQTLDRHLQDAITVRDRLLKIVEKQMEVPLGKEAERIQVQEAPAQLFR